MFILTRPALSYILTRSLITLEFFENGNLFIIVDKLPFSKLQEVTAPDTTEAIMRHINLSGWQYRREPFPAFVSWALGNRKDGFLLVEGVQPLITYQVIGNAREVLYSGVSLDDAQNAKRNFEVISTEAAEVKLQNSAVIKEGPFELPNGLFALKQSRSNAIIVVEGKDDSSGLLLMAGARSGIRGSVSVYDPVSNASIIRKIFAATGNEAEIQVAAVLQVGQRLALVSDGRGVNRLDVYCWDGISLKFLQGPIQNWKGDHF